MSAKFEPIVGRYMNLDLLGKPHRLYSRKRARARRCSACTPPAATAGNIAA
jgi:phosphoribosyl-dephospho-CoA transferase